MRFWNFSRPLNSHSSQRHLVETTSKSRYASKPYKPAENITEFLQYMTFQLTTPFYIIPIFDMFWVRVAPHKATLYEIVGHYQVCDIEKKLNKNFSCFDLWLNSYKATLYEITGHYQVCDIEKKLNKIFFVFRPIAQQLQGNLI